MDSVLGIPYKTYNYMNDFGMNVYVLAILIVILVSYYLFFSKLALNSETGEKSVYTRMLEIGLWAVFIALVILNGLQYFFNVNFTSDISSLFTNNPQLDVKVKQMDNYDASTQNQNIPSQYQLENAAKVNAATDLSEANDSDTSLPDENEVHDKEHEENDVNSRSPASKNEIKEVLEKDNDTTVELSGKTGVFHIPTNNFSYDDSKKICKAYGARLATFNDLEKAYEDGADWCSYGWSENQMALYPTQKKRWNKLQTIKGHENDCGRPGINGGYIGNPEAEFGVNCYGKRPEIREIDRERMKNTTIYPKTSEEIQFEKDVDGWKKKLPDMHISPFNYEKWNP